MRQITNKKFYKLSMAPLLVGVVLFLIWKFAYPDLFELLLSSLVIIALAVGMLIGRRLYKKVKKILILFMICGIVLILAGKDPGRAFNTEEKVKSQLVLSGSVFIALGMGMIFARLDVSS